MIWVCLLLTADPAASALPPPQATAFRATLRYRDVANGRTATAIAVGIRNGDGYALTSEHVTRNSKEPSLQRFEAPGAPIPATEFNRVSVVWSDAASDLALIRFPLGKAELPICPLSSWKDVPKRGDYPLRGFSIGCGNGDLPRLREETLLGRPLIKDKDGLPVAFFIETQAPGDIGRSGGPLCDATGRLIGVTSATQGGKGYSTALEEILGFLTKNGEDWLIPAK